MVDEEKPGITRRKFTLGVLIAAASGAAVSLFSMLKVLAPEKKGSGYVSTVSPGDKLVYASGNNAGEPVLAGSLGVGDAVLVYPEGKSSNAANLVQLIRLNESDYKPPARINLTDKGFVAYSAICTHLGCTVSWVRNKVDPDASYTECFCHNSMFDPARGAKVIGGPAPVPLAQIGVKVTPDGHIAFTSGFTGPIGPQV